MKTSNREHFRSIAYATISKPFAEVFLIDDLTAIAFSGRKSKSDFYIKFQSTQQRINHVNNYINEKQKYFEQKEKQKNFNITDFVQVGDVLISKWGFEQTNNDYYQITNIKGKTITLRSIEHELLYDQETMTGKTIPLVGQFTSEPFNKKPSLDYDGKSISVKITSYSYAYPATKIFLPNGTFVYQYNNASYYA
jgi:hypothetical protein